MATLAEHVAKSGKMKSKERPTWLPVNGKDVIAFAASSRFVLLHVKPQLFALNSDYLAEQFFSEHPDTSFGSVSSEGLSRFCHWYFRLQLAEIDIETQDALPGYYLFKNQKLIAWYPEHSRELKIAAGIAGLIAFGVRHKWMRQDTLEASIGALGDVDQFSYGGAFAFFKEAAESYSEPEPEPRQQERQRKRQNKVFIDALSQAYETLGAAPTATDAEIKKAYRALVLQHHPDHGGDESTMKSINDARDLIFAHRGS